MRHAPTGGDSACHDPGPGTGGLPSRQYSIEEFINTTSVSGAGFSHDGSRILLGSNKTGVWNVYSMPATGGEWTPITRSTTDNIGPVRYFPHDDRLLVRGDKGGNELDHLYVIGRDGSQRDLTPGEKLNCLLYTSPSPRD